MSIGTLKIQREGSENMEYPSRFDFFIQFKAIFNHQGKFNDYVLVNTSENFRMVAGVKSETLIGEKISKIVVERKDIFGLQDFYYNMIPGTRRKYEKYIEELDRTYIINIFSDDRDYLILFYTDITSLKKSTEKQKKDGPLSEDNLYAFEKKSEKYFKDSLTGLYNKAFFEEELLRLDTSRQLPLSVVMGDLNGLKLINDAFGHEMGDKALKKVAEVIKDASRKEDIISRVGGDEFMILLPNTNEETVTKIVDRMKTAFKQNPLDFINISISFGSATKLTGEEDIHKLLKLAENRMYFLKLKEGKEAKLEMINYLKKRLEKITFETKAHYDRLKTIGMQIADKLNLTEIEKEELILLCEFHDIGKIGIPAEILQKTQSLNKEEWEDMKRHSEIGYNIIKESRETIAIDELILLHHENWDGSGYPGLFKSEEIPKVVRIFSIIDAYDAMINDRPYKKKMTTGDALKEIEAKAGSQFDPNIARTFIETMQDFRAS